MDKHWSLLQSGAMVYVPLYFCPLREYVLTLLVVVLVRKTRLLAFELLRSPVSRLEVDAHTEVILETRGCLKNRKVILKILDSVRVKIMCRWYTTVSLDRPTQVEYSRWRRIRPKYSRCTSSLPALY